MGEVKTEMENAINTLGLSNQDISLLDDVVGEEVFKDCVNYFVRSGDRKWWWEDFKKPFFYFKDFDNPLQYLNKIIPEVEGLVWLIVEDDKELFYPVYEVKPAIIAAILNECFYFEYYIIYKNKEWLICENHHNTLFGIGAKLKEKNLAVIMERDYNLIVKPRHLPRLYY